MAGRAKKPTFKNTFEHEFYSFPRHSAAVQQRLLDLIVGSYSTELKDALVVGVNNCTESIRELALLFVCKADARPPVLVDHLPLICRLNRVHLLTLPPNSCAEIGHLLEQDLRSKRVLALGVKQNSAEAFIQQVLGVVGSPALSDPASCLPPAYVKKIPVSRR